MTHHHTLTHLILTTFFAITLTILGSCASDSSSPVNDSGMIHPIVTIDPTVIDDDNAGPSQPTVGTAPLPEEMSSTLATADGSLSHSWASLADFPVDQPFLAGKYNLDVYSGSDMTEGVDCPYFTGSAEFTLNGGEEAQPEVVCTLANTMLDVDFTSGFSEYFADCSVTFHSHGGRYVDFSHDETRYVFLRPGDIDVSLNLTLADGRSCSVYMTCIKNALPRHCYTATLTLSTDNPDVPAVTLSLDERISTDNVTIRLTPALLAAKAPEIHCEGFADGSPLHITEGSVPDHSIAATVDAASLLSGLFLSTNSPTLLAGGWPAEINLMEASESDMAAMRSFGLALVSSADGSLTVDFTKVVPNLRLAEGITQHRLQLQARTRTNIESRPAILAVELGGVDVTLIEVSEAVMGIDSCTMRISLPAEASLDDVAVEILGDDGQWTAPAETIRTPGAGGHSATITFDVPAGQSDIGSRILYCGAVKATTSIRRRAPEFNISVDAFSHSAVVMIESSDPGLTSYITRNASIYANGVPTLELARMEDNGVITVTGLKADTRYTLRATVLTQPRGNADFTAPVDITTEKAQQLPNADFEERRKSVEYRNLPSGGRYSQTIVGIFNRQNHANIKQEAPQSWANVNAKTFCMDAARHNTWYMQPSTESVLDAYLNSYGVRIQSVGWDIDGPEIPDYRQPDPPYTDYSRNIPRPAHRSAGRLFLGSYRFDPATMTETYDEGIEFASRPMALNGFYKYLPGSTATAERGFVRVEVTGISSDGAEITIAKAETALPAATGYTAFTVPLSYTVPGVKATKIKVLLASSTAVGTIDEETASVITIADPVTATYRGSTLWVDALSLSY